VNVLVLNCGSTSVKFEVIGDPAPRRGEGTRAGGPRGGPGRDAPPEARLARGEAAPLGPDGRWTLAAAGGDAVVEPAPGIDHAGAVARALDWTAAGGLRVDAVGHRVVHGGARFLESTLIDDAVLRAIESLETLAPLHNAPSLAGIRAARVRLGSSVPMAAVFDTSFHARMPEAAATYAIPSALAERHGLRRYGFHGTAFRSVLAGYAALTGADARGARIVALHLGGGCSAAAIRDGRSVETSMGFTPLEGLVMGTRSGDLDPAIVAHVAEREGIGVSEVVRTLNEASGLLGLSGRTADVRELLAREAKDPRARLALDVFCHRIRKYLGAYLAVLGGADAILWSGGVGEHASEIRWRVCDGLGPLGVALDPRRNGADSGAAREIGAEEAPVRSYVIPADEAIVIARDTAACAGW
jgi:acetate kinase